MSKTSNPPLPSLGKLISAEEDAGCLREIVVRLWDLLDAIDTASDWIKPVDEAGYKRFYQYAMEMCEARHVDVTSDGFDLYLPTQVNND